MIRATIATTAAAFLLSACAQSASSIPPVSMGTAYNGLDCRTAYHEREAASASLATLSEAQQSAVAADAIGVLILGVPMASLTGGDKGAEIGVAKGQVEALNARLLTCGA